MRRYSVTVTCVEHGNHTVVLATELHLPDGPVDTICNMTADEQRVRNRKTLLANHIRQQMTAIELGDEIAEAVADDILDACDGKGRHG